MDLTILEEGTVFAVPVGQPRRWVLGVISRTDRQGLAVVYLFEPPCADLPQSPPSLSPSDATLIARLSDAGLRTGEWPVIGSHPNWDRGNWSAVEFVRFNRRRNQYIASLYADEDGAEFLSERIVDEEVFSELPMDTLFGQEAIEIELENRLTH